MMSRYPCQPLALRAVLSSVMSEYNVVNDSVVVSGITQDSRFIAAGDVFCCVRGETFNGADYIVDAISAGAVAVVVDTVVPDVPAHIAVVTVPDVRQFLGPFASAIFGHPSRSLRMVGVTGTNGKTSTTSMIASVLEAEGMSTRVIGTLSGERTTPEAIDLHATLRKWVNEDVSAVVMEVSSHALVLHRVDGIMFEVAVFTNIGRDHLDFHKTEEAYFAAKARLFSSSLAKVGVVNTDDPKGSLLNDAAPIPMVGFSRHDAHDISLAVDHVAYSWNGLSLRIPMGGEFTLMNSLAAVTAAHALGVSRESVTQGLLTMTPVPGRFEPITTTLGFGVIVDYAHTPESLQSVLVSARSMCAGRLIVVFGCGGNRDHGKRPLMGAIAEANADRVIVTSDNPRLEDPHRIINDIFQGISTTAGHCSQEVDREIAIASAISEAERDDIVVIAGKGHESTQDIAGVLHPFLDADVARKYVAQREETTK